jgi:hypothetical protein
MSDGRDDDAELAPASEAELAERPGEPPVVARMVIEIRSDGSRTIARGALEDTAAGHKVAVEAEGDTPMQLAFALARSLFKVPAIARTTARALLPGRRKK